MPLFLVVNVGEPLTAIALIAAGAACLSALIRCLSEPRYAKRGQR